MLSPARTLRAATPPPEWAPLVAAAKREGKVVINATGAWADDLRTDLGHDRRLRRIRGSHLTFKQERFPLPEAVSLLHPRDQRAVVMRCTATNVTPAHDSVVKNSHCWWNARHA